VSESIANPAQYYSNNVSGTFALFDAMLAKGVRRIVFASSCSVYGNASSEFIGEEHATVPMSTYGESKLIAERALQRYQHAYGLQFVALRYFNVAGADAEASLGEDPRTSCRIIPRAFQAAKNGGPFQIFGTSFDTANGTAVRDYVHVRDIAMANVLAIRYLEAGEPSTVVNLGAGIGLSVRQIVDEVGRVLGEDVPVREVAARIGDPAYAVADVSKAGQVLGWRPAHSTLGEIVGSAVAYYSGRSDLEREQAGALPEVGPEDEKIAILR
jgi:UDP-glucose-4-epimerase GalE